MRRSIAAMLALAALLCTRSAAPSAGHGKGGADGPGIFTPASLKWKDGLPSMPPGAKVALLEGDPTRRGPFVMRVKFPAGYRVPPHAHPRPERVTVISGTLYIGMGAKFDRAKGKAMPAGTYGTWPAGMKHFGWAEGETVIQLHGDGPWAITYVNPADDPRNAKK